MKFKKYDSIENSYRQKMIDKITIDRELMGQSWFVHEKVHGANMSLHITCEGENLSIRISKRSGYVEAGEKFYGLENNVEKLLEYASKVGSFIAEHSDVGTSFNAVVRGEFYGGGYNHPDVPSTVDPRIQKGVEYTNANEFLAFDLEVNEEIQSVDTAEIVFKSCEVPQVPFLFSGSFSDCLDYKNEFDSLVPAMHGHPEIENNICEGTVIKPRNVSYFPNGSRVILKNKNDKFTEKDTKKTKAKVVVFSPEQNKAVENLSQFINENRLRNVLSHFGEVTQKMFGKISGLLAQDAILDYLKEYEQLPEKKDWKLVTKQTQMTCAILLRSHWLDILDGEY